MMMFCLGPRGVLIELYYVLSSSCTSLDLVFLVWCVRRSSVYTLAGLPRVLSVICVDNAMC